MSNPTNSAPVTDGGQVPNSDTTNNPASGTQNTPPTSPQVGDNQGLTLEQALDALKKARQEAAQNRTKLSSYEAEEEKRKQAAMSDLEKAQTRAQELETLSQAQAKQLQEMRVMQSVMLSANTHNLVDAEAAAKLIDWAAIEYDDQGNPKNIEKLIADLAKAKPYLVAQPQQTPLVPKAPSMNPGRSQVTPPQQSTQPFNYQNRPTLGAIWNKEK